MGEGGTRILVDHIWPRGFKYKICTGCEPRKSLPVTACENGYNHKPDTWTEFKERYFAELDEKPQAVGEITSLLKENLTILLYSGQDKRRQSSPRTTRILKNVSKLSY